MLPSEKAETLGLTACVISRDIDIMSSNRHPSRLLIEAMTAASEFIAEDMRRDFLIIGGAALARYGSARHTRDVDIAITPQTLNAFCEKAGNDSRFAIQPDGHWEYTGQGLGLEGLLVEFEFLAIGEGFVPKLRGLTKFGSVWVASLADISVMKARAFQGRNEARDYEDLLYALRKMKTLEQTLAKYRIKRSQIETILSVVEGDEEGEALLSDVMGS